MTVISSNLSSFFLLLNVFCRFPSLSLYAQDSCFEGLKDLFVLLLFIFQSILFSFDRCNKFSSPRVYELECFLVPFPELSLSFLQGWFFYLSFCLSFILISLTFLTCKLGDSGFLLIFRKDECVLVSYCCCNRLPQTLWLKNNKKFIILWL